MKEDVNTANSVIFNIILSADRTDKMNGLNV